MYLHFSYFTHLPQKDDPERDDLKSRFLLFILLFFFPLFLGGKRKGENNNQSRDFKSCLSESSSKEILKWQNIKGYKVFTIDWNPQPLSWLAAEILELGKGLINWDALKGKGGGVEGHSLYCTKYRAIHNS